MADVVSIVEAPRSAPLAQAGDGRLRPLGPLARFSLRLPEAAVPAAGAALGIGLTMPINRAGAEGERSALRLGPDEWLILAPEAGADSVPLALNDAISDGVFSLVDIGHRQTGILLEGLDAAAIINALCPLDLDAGAFPIGMATRTVFGKAEIVLWRTGAERFHIEVWRSFAPYVWAVLTEIGREYPM